MSALGAGAEFDRIRAIAAMLGPRAAELGDDCALVPIDGGFLAISTDVSVDEVHFRRDWLTLTEVGWRAAWRCLPQLRERPLGGDRRRAPGPAAPSAIS